MTNTRQKIIIIDLIGNIHTVLSIYVSKFANYNNLICYLVTIRALPFNCSFSNKIQQRGRQRVKQHNRNILDYFVKIVHNKEMLVMQVQQKD